MFIIIIIIIKEETDLSDVGQQSCCKGTVQFISVFCIIHRCFSELGFTHIDMSMRVTRPRKKFKLPCWQYHCTQLLLCFFFGVEKLQYLSRLCHFCYYVASEIRVMHCAKFKCKFRILNVFK